MLHCMSPDQHRHHVLEARAFAREARVGALDDILGTWVTPPTKDSDGNIVDPGGVGTIGGDGVMRVRVVGPVEVSSYFFSALTLVVGAGIGFSIGKLF